MKPITLTLRPYQLAALDFLAAAPRANLHIEPGLGKTAIVLHHLAAHARGRTLVVAPRLVARQVWGTEAAKWGLPLKTSVLAGTPAQRSGLLLNGSDLTVVNPELLPWLFEALDGKWPFRTVVFDESTRLRGLRSRGHGTQRAALLASVAPKTERWVNLSGSPSANSLLDLWGPQFVVDFGASLGRSYSAFAQRWFVPKDPYFMHSELIPTRNASTEIARAIAPTTFTLRAAEHFPTTAAVHHVIETPLSLPGRRAYDQMRKKLVIEHSKGEITALNASIKAAKLRQVLSGAVYDGKPGNSYARIHSDRIEALKSLKEELAGAPLLVVTYYQHEIQEIRNAFPEMQTIHDTLAMERWNAGELPLLVLHAASAGHGINLAPGGHHMVFFSQYSDAELYAQVLERLGPVRQKQAGLDRLVHVYHFFTPDSIDDLTQQRRINRLSALDSLMMELRK